MVNAASEITPPDASFRNVFCAPKLSYRNPPISVLSTKVESKRPDLKNLSSSSLSPQLNHRPRLYTMASLTQCSRTLLRSIPRTQLSALPIRALSTTSSKSRASATELPAGTSSFDSPFKGQGNSPTDKIPDFSHYRSKAGTNSNLVFQYCTYILLLRRLVLTPRSPSYG
jgi:hypothetical protein